MKYATLTATALLTSAALTTTALAGPINGDGLVTPDVIFGSGNANGSFTGVNVEGLELGLRGKLRYNLSGAAENTFNYDDDRTYLFDPADSDAPADRSAFNFEWSINTDSDGTLGRFLADLIYELRIDYDPTAGTDFVSFDPIASGGDHAFGDNSTGNGGGTVATDAASYVALATTSNVAQNSWNLGFFEPAGFDPQTQGIYTIELSASSATAGELASTSIDIVYGDVPADVPVPAPVLLIGAGLLGLAWRSRKSA